MTHHTNTGGISNSDIGDNTGRFSILAQVREGMDVYDVRENRIGSVRLVHFGAASETQQELGTGPAAPSAADDPNMRRDTIIDNIAEAFDPVDLPVGLREKLLLSGFVRLDTSGLFAADRFITPDQIVRVADDNVYLSVERDQLFERR